MKPFGVMGTVHVTQDLLDYWIRHPQAQGAVESIVEWWLLEQRIQKVADEVRVALTDLVKKGFVLERVQGDGRVLYRLNLDQEAEIRSWLESHKVTHRCNSGRRPGAN